MEGSLFQTTHGVILYVWTMAAMILNFKTTTEPATASKIRHVTVYHLNDFRSDSGVRVDGI